MPSRADAGGEDVSEKACTSCGTDAAAKYCLVCVDEQLAAAEERGRRRGVEAAATLCDHRANGHEIGSAAGLEARKCANAVRSLAPGGVEERDELRALLSEARECLDIATGERRGPDDVDLVVRIDAAIAPRDSAPREMNENDVAASCFGVAPRDSGKDDPGADAGDAVTNFAGAVHTTTAITLSYRDRLRVLFGARLVLKVHVRTQYRVGATETSSSVAVGASRRCPPIVHATNEATKKPSDGMAAAQMAAVLHTVGGEVDGRPTSAINYLQRLRSLVAMEKASGRGNK